MRPSKSRSIVWLSSLVLVTALLACILLFAQVASPPFVYTLRDLPTPGKYDPAAYGLPDEVAGYSVLAVVDEASIQFCPTPGTLTMVIQVPQDNVREFLRSGDTQRTLRDAMHELDPTGKAIQYSAVGPGITREKIQNDYATLESRLQGVGCPAPVRMDHLPPRVTLTPTQNSNIAPSATPPGN
ncbi:MAG: hypothetical protein ABI690_25535 [Chloroflexota bacterium]